MSHTNSSLLVHLVWSTKNREPFIKKELKPRLYQYMRSVVENEGAKLLCINGVEDHVHLLIAMPLTLLIPDLIAKIKPVSTKWVKRIFPELKEFRWQKGYGAFSIGLTCMPSVIKYIENQENHHRTVSFQAELIYFLEAHMINYDKNTIFD